MNNLYSKSMVALIVFLNAVFTAGIMYVFSKVGREPTVLIGCWFGFTTGELWLLASIRKSKVKGVDTGGKRYFSSSSNHTGEMSGVNQEMQGEGNQNRYQSDPKNKERAE